MSRRLLSTMLLALAACATQVAGKTLVLQYDDFGPPAAAHELIGMDWWQWQAHGDSRPRHYGIKVVVYRDMERPRVRRMFPIDPTQEQDYRYVEYAAALSYLDRMIEEDAIESLTQQLRTTRTRILSAFGELQRGGK